MLLYFFIIDMRVLSPRRKAGVRKLSEQNQRPLFLRAMGPRTNEREEER